MVCPKCVLSLWRGVKAWMRDIFMIVMKTLRIRRRRYVAFLLEIFTPIIIASLIAWSNSFKPLLRADLHNHHKRNVSDEQDNFKHLERFFDLGHDTDQYELETYVICKNRKSPYPCLIGYVCDDETMDAVFTDQPDDKVPLTIQLSYIHDPKKTRFVRFKSEKALEDCIMNPHVCQTLNEEKLIPESERVLSFRGAIIFETGVSAKEVKYKIRLLETHFGSLRHVRETGQQKYSKHDRNDYSLSYLRAGFLTMQLNIDRLIVQSMKNKFPPNDPIAKELTFRYDAVESGESKCTCEVIIHEMAHRESELFHDPEFEEKVLRESFRTEDTNKHDHERVLQYDKRKEIQKRNYRIDQQSLVVSTILVVCFTLLIPSEQRRITSEKENGLTILLLVTGMTYRMQWIGNLVAVVIAYILTVTCVVLILTIDFDTKDYGKGPVFKYCDPAMLWIMLMLYVMALASACYFSTVFFDKPMAAITTVIFIFISTFVVIINDLDYSYREWSIWIILVICLQPAICLQFALRLLIRFERHEIDGKKGRFFDTMFRQMIPTDDGRMFYFLLMLILDTVLYMSLAIYFDRILKSKYGVSKPWYYIFNPAEYCSKNRVAPHVKNVERAFVDQPGFEHIGMYAKPTIICENLTKKYGKNVALDKLNVQMYHGEIFALLGPNGSGKSSLLHLFSGFTKSSSGTAYIDGLDINKDMVQIQAFTGMCPQSNWLYEDLSPYEHLLIFGRLRGLKGEDAIDECIEWLERLHIEDMTHWPVRSLAQGEKRRLSLAIALIGNPQVVLLDEPTAGLDYYSRRAVWDVLLKIRSNHTIIFSTHFMDEAELLGDKIGILVDGKMEVCGSHSFIRQYLGLGYSIKLKLDSHLQNPEKSTQEIEKVVHDCLPTAVLCTLPYAISTNRLVTFNVPEKGFISDQMTSLFADLARVKRRLGITGFSVSLSSMDDCFLALIRQLKPETIVDKAVDNNDDDQRYHEEDYEQNIQKLSKGKNKCCRSLYHFLLLFHKRFLFTLRHWPILFLQVVLPIILYVLAMISLTRTIPYDISTNPEGPLEINIEKWKGGELKNPITLYYASNRSFITAEILKNVIGPSATPSEYSDIAPDYILMNYGTLRDQHVVGISVDSGLRGTTYVHYSPYFVHSSALAVNLFSNTLVKRLDMSRAIRTTNHPLPNPYFSGYYLDEFEYAPVLYAINLTLALVFGVGYCMLYPLEERLSGVKHLCLSYVRPAVYWFSLMTFDMLILLMDALFGILFINFYPPTKIIFAHEVVSIKLMNTLIFVSFMYSMTWFTYFVTHMVHSKSGGYSFVMSVTLAFGLIVPFYMFGIFGDTSDLRPWIVYGLKLNPIYAFASAKSKHARTLLAHTRCAHFTEYGKSEYCSDAEDREVQCCPNCEDLTLNQDGCYTYKAFFDPQLEDFWEMDTKTKKKDWYVAAGKVLGNDFLESRSVIFEVVSLICSGLLFNFLTIFLDSDAWVRLKSCALGLRGRAFQTDVDDDDVLDEMDYVERMVARDETNSEALLVQSLCKNYGAYPAMHNMSFFAHPGECFGVLGVNGAGKTTLFDIVSGALAQSYGNIYSVNCSLQKNRRRLMQKIGYMPQSGTAMFSYMSLMENITFFGLLRGLRRKEAKQQSLDILKQLGLDHLKNKKPKNMSLGIRRRVGLGIAIVGDPPIVLLDEPTNAADPASRRQYWEIFKQIKNAGQTLILSSHRINECEELCHRLGIMVDGKFQCIGSPKHLKRKFGSGFKLLVKLYPGQAENKGYVTSLSNAIVTTFPSCDVRDRRRNVIQYVIKQSNIQWEFLFKMMEHTKLRYNDLVEDYSFSNTTLEEIFLAFVRFRNCGRQVDPGKKFCWDCTWY